MKKSKLILLFFLVTFSMNFCSKNVDVVSMNEFQDKILDQKTIVLDVRTEEEYYGPLGHIEGAILIPINELENRLVELDEYRDDTIYVVCRSGNRSGKATKILIDAGYINAINAGSIQEASNLLKSKIIK